MANQHITDATNKYFCIMPNMTDEDLDPYQYRLYGHYKRVCGDSGSCWESTRTTATKTKMSIGKVTTARRELQELGYIRIDESGKTLNIRIVDIMPVNIERFSKCSPHEQECSPHEPKKNKEEEPKKDSKNIPEPSSGDVLSRFPDTAMVNWIDEDGNERECLLSELPPLKASIPTPTPPVKGKSRKTTTTGTPQPKSRAAAPPAPKRASDSAYAAAKDYYELLDDVQTAKWDTTFKQFCILWYAYPQGENRIKPAHRTLIYKVLHRLWYEGVDVNADTVQGYYDYVIAEYGSKKYLPKDMDKIEAAIVEFVNKLEAKSQTPPPAPRQRTDVAYIAQLRAQQQQREPSDD